MKNRKTNIDRPELSSEEINKGKNFDQLYSNYTNVSKPFFKQNWFIANSIIVGIAGIIVAFFLLNDNLDKPVELSNIELNKTNKVATNPVNEDIQSIQPYVNPPLKGLNVPFSSYIIHVNKASTIKHKTGSLIIIPKNAFVNANDELVTGKVEIRYREFKDIAEIFASGIPMIYDSANIEYHFESAGMIEILAFQNGKPVFMNPKKKIDIEMTSDYSGNAYNLYSLDTSNRKWVYIGKDKVIEKNESSVIIQASESAPYLDDDLSNEPQLMELTPEKNTTLKTIQNEIIVIQKDVKKIESTEPEKPLKATDKRFKFNLDVNKSEFPEIAIYEGTQFEIGKENKNFDPKLTNLEWHDISLSKNSNDKYILTLKRYLTKEEQKNNSDSIMDTKNFIVYPVYEGTNYEVAIADFNKKYDAYSTTLKNRLEDERIKKEEYARKLEEFKVENEKRQKEWEQNSALRKESNETNNRIYRAFSVYTFGTYNCDSPVKFPSGQSVLATFMDANNKSLTITALYLVEKNRNAIFRYYNGDPKFKFNPKAKNFLIGVTLDNKLITYTNEQFKDIPTQATSFDFKMNIEESTPENIKELKKCISYL